MQIYVNMCKYDNSNYCTVLARLHSCNDKDANAIVGAGVMRAHVSLNAHFNGGIRLCVIIEIDTQIKYKCYIIDSYKKVQYMHCVLHVCTPRDSLAMASVLGVCAQNKSASERAESVQTKRERAADRRQSPSPTRENNRRTRVSSGVGAAVRQQSCRQQSCRTDNTATRASLAFGLEH